MTRVCATAILGPSVCCGLLIFTTLLFSIVASAKAPAKPIPDPKEWCGDAIKLMAEKNVDGLFEAISLGARKPTEMDVIAQEMSSLPPLLRRVGDFVYSAPLDAKVYDESFARYWHLVVYDLAVLYVRCELINEGESWGLKDFTYATDAEKIDLP